MTILEKSFGKRKERSPARDASAVNTIRISLYQHNKSVNNYKELMLKDSHKLSESEH